MKKIVLILIGVLAGGSAAWAHGPYCGPLPPLPAPVLVHRAPIVRVGYCAPPTVVVAPPVAYSMRVVYATPVIITPPPVYVAPAPPPLPPPPIVYQAPVVYTAPVACWQPTYCAPPALQLVAALPLFPFWCGSHHGGGYRGSWSHGGGHCR